MTIPLTSKIVMISLAFLCAVAVGWKSAPDLGKAAVVEAKPERIVSRERVAGGRDSAAREVARKMKSVRDGATQEERIRASISLAMSLPASEFAAWAAGDRFDFRAGPELSIFRMILFERWIAEEPDSLIAFAVENDHGQASRAFEHLMKDDPERILAFFRAHPNDSFELEKLTAIASSNPQLVMARLAEMSGRGMTADAGEASEKLFRELAGKSPAILEAALDGLSPVLRKKAETALCGVRLATDFQGEIRALWERPDGWEMFNDNLQSNPKLGAKFLEELASMPSSWRNSLGDFPYYAVREETARKWLEMDLEKAGFSNHQVERIRSHAAERLIRIDPDFVMGLIGSLSLDKGEKAELFQSAFLRFWNSPEMAESLIAKLGSDEDKAAAREQLERLTLNHAKQGVKTPADWIDALGSGGATGSSAYSFAAAAGRWDEKQVSEFRSGFNELPAKEKQNLALALASRAEYTDGNRALVSDAIGYLLHNPPEQDRQGSMMDDPRMMASQYALRLASQDLSSASVWIDTLPAGEARMWAQRNVAKDLRQYDPAAVRDWIKTLPQAERDDLNKYLAGEE